MQQGEQQPGLWRPLVVAGAPLHLVLPAATLIASVALLLAGGLLSILGGWLLTVGFGVAVGAFVTDERAICLPPLAWLGWWLAGALAGDAASFPQTPLALALPFAALAGAAAWLGQRGVAPAVEAPHATTSGRAPSAPDIDALLVPVHDPADSPSLDPGAEVDEALAALLEAPIDEGSPSEAAVGAVEAAAEAVAAASEAVDAAVEAIEAAAPAGAPARGAEEAPATGENTQGKVEPEEAASGVADDVLDEGGHVIEFAALSEDDFDDLPERDDEAAAAPLPAATEAGRRDDA